MTYKFILTSILFISLTILETKAQLPIPEGRRLRDIVEQNYPDGKLLIGGTTGAWGLNESIGKLVDREFSYVTPENDFKHTTIRYNPDYWNWSSADAWIQHIKDNNQVLRIHGPIAPQCSNWAKEDIRTAEELSEELDTFMTALCQRYNGVEGIKYLDVVNEIVLEDGSWFGPRTGTDQWENPWLKIGQDDDPNKTPLYVKQAFGIANEHAPDLKQIINNHCHPGTQGMEKVKETALYLLDRGYRVDGIGWQAHIDVGWATEENLQHLRDVIDWCQERNLEFHITEFDAFIKNPTTQSLEDQAYTYKSILDVLLEKLDSLTIGWNSWQITDAHGWRTEYIPAVFDENYYPKPAYYAYQLALETKGDYNTPFNVSFNIKNAETGEFIDSCDVLFVDSVKQSNEEGIAAFQNVTAGRYTYQIKKRFFDSLTKKNFNIYSDTTITLFLSPSVYSTTFHMQNQNNGNPIISISVSIDTLLSLSGIGGDATFDLRPGTYLVTFENQGYESFESEYSITSDTTINVLLKQTIANIKFRVRNEEQPINYVQVILNADTLYTNSVGTVTFEAANVDSSYFYSLSKDKYKPVEGSLILGSDTTVNLQMEKSVANIQFQITPDINNPDIGYIVLNGDTTFFSEEGSLKLYDLPIDNEYPYEIIHENYPNIIDTVYLTSDTTINVSMAISLVEQDKTESITVYPNPTAQTILIKSGSFIKKAEIYNLVGHKVLEFNVNDFIISKELSHIPGGIYFMNIYLENNKTQVIRFVKVVR